MVAEENALRLLRDHGSGAREVSETELTAARAVVVAAAERRAKAKPQQSKQDDNVALKLPDVDMDTVAAAWRLLFGHPVSISPSARSKVVRIAFSAVPREEAQKKLIAGLMEHGIYVVSGPNGPVLDTKPAAEQPK